MLNIPEYQGFFRGCQRQADRIYPPTPKTVLKCVQNPKRNPKEEPYVRQPKILLPETQRKLF